MNIYLQKHNLNFSKMDNQQKTIIGIDPGASGGIATFGNGRIQAVKMPKDVNEMQKYLRFLKNTYPNPIIFIEKVSEFRGSDDDAGGKKFGINKMLKNYAQLTTIITLEGFEFVEVYPISWQSKLGLRIHKEKITKTERKNRYKIFAQNCFPELGKITLATSDALCLVQFGMDKLKNEPSYVLKNLQNRQETGMFE